MGNCFLYQRGFGGGFGGGGGSTPEVEKTASGKGIAILDSVEKPLKGLRLFGKTTQNGTPSPTAPVPLVSAGDGGSIIVTIGTSESDTNPQILTVSTPNGLPGIHVSEGGNYTDENGWQWVCDEIDFAGRKYVQRIDCFIFTGNESLGDGAKVGSHGFYVYAKNRTVQGKVNSESMCNKIKARKYTLQVGDGNRADAVNLASGGSGTNFPRLCIAHSLIGTSESSSVSECKSAVQNWLKAQYDEGSPLIVFSQLETPIETPLTSQELAQYAALYTYDPSTTIYNDAGADMEVKYMAKGG